MLKRPSPKDTEEDLLRFQDEYLTSIGKKQTSEAAAAVYKNPKAAVGKNMSQVTKKLELEEEEEHGDPAWFPDEKASSVLLGDIVERPFEASRVTLPTGFKNNGGFPEVDTLPVVGDALKKKGSRGISLFARQMLAKNSKVDLEIDEESSTDAAAGASSFSLEDQSKMMQDIDVENRRKLAEMTRQEIAADQAELSRILPNNLLVYLKNRRGNETTAKPKLAEFDEEKKKKTGGNGDLPIKPDPKWVHMDQVESDKLEWTKDVPVTDAAIKELKAFETRFDFAGDVAAIVGDVELSPSACALYHHGEEPDRPGYTLSELLELARSSVIPQRVLALRTLAAICRKARRGHYASLGLDKPVIPCLLDAGIAFTIRQSLDDSSSEGNALASLTALHDLLIAERDTNLLDQWQSVNTTNGRFPYFCDKIVTSPTSDDEIKQLDDARLMSRDVVLCLVFRTNLLARLRYIFCDWPIADAKIRRLVIAILLRVARHSPACASQIANGASGQRLMARLCQDDAISEPNCLRLLATMAVAVPTAVTSHFDLNRIVDFVVQNSSEEALELLGSLSKTQTVKNIALALGQRFVEIETIQLSKSTTENLRYLAKILRLFALIQQGQSDEDQQQGLYNFENVIYGLLEPIFLIFPEKITNSLLLNNNNEDFVTFLASAFSLASCSPSSVERMTISSQFLRLIETALTKSIASSISHSSHSIVLQSDELRRNNESPRSLQYLSSAANNFSAQHWWCLGTAICQFFANSPSKLFPRNLLKSSPEIDQYFRMIANKRSQIGFVNNFFHLNFELNFVASYLSNAVVVDNDNDMKTLYIAVVKLSSLLPALMSPQIWKIFFDGFIFNPVVLKSLDSKLTDSIQSVRSVYHDALDVLLMSSNRFASFSASALCKDWLYFPLAAAGITVSPAMMSTAVSPDDVMMPALRHRVVVAVLRFARFALRTIITAEEMTPLTHFVRLSALYLNDDVFGGAAGELEGVRGLLADCLTSLLSQTKSQLNFTERVPGLDCTLPDFYIALLEQFKAASYGDVVFGNVLLLFAAANQPVVFRRLLWGDHREVLTFLRHLRQDQLLIDLDLMLQPFESDLHVIKLYAEFVFSEIVSSSPQKPSSVLWLVAVNHLNAFLFDSSADRKNGHLLRKSIWQALAQQSDCSEMTPRKLKLKDVVFYKFVPNELNHQQRRQYEALPQNRFVFLRSILGETSSNSLLLSLTH